MKGFSFALVLFSLMAFTSSTVSAHGGRLNSSGCHNERKTGGYHCHRSSGYSASRNSSSKSGINATKPIKKDIIRTSSNKVNSLSKKATIQISSDLTTTDIIQLQTYLDLLGYDIGVIDGIAGEKTKRALELYRLKHSNSSNQVFSKKSLTLLKSRIKLYFP
ncbi:YHYH domain-containing protein [Marinomonas sp. S3726]|uniref:YHYH domain-containing protein n=1 Tax=Marinomonas sp. S3726 TaxID=579484 RepID=UPI000698131E|nr:YHYH domain-containing protein [Marinomonas sp. S3726]